MRKTGLILLLAAFLPGLLPSLTHADGMILPHPEGLAPGYLVVRYHHVTVTIDDLHAITRVEQEFYNPYDVPVTGQYVFPVPPEAMLTRFEARLDGLLQQATRQKPAEADAALYASVVQHHDPSLLQYAGWETLSFDLSLPPGGARRMSLEYEQVLPPRGGLVHYRYVLSTERYSSQPLEEVSVTVDLSSSSGLSNLYVPGHTVATERLGPGRARVRWEARYVNPSQDFELYYTPSSSGYGGGLLTGERQGLDHFLFLFSPDLDPDHTRALAKDIVFVIDRSGSMADGKLEQAQSALHFVLGQLGEDDRFAIVGFDEHISALDDTLQPVEARTLQAARRFVDRLSPGGYTDLEAALQAGLGILHRSGERGAARLVVFLTDGLPTAGITGEAQIARLVTATNGSPFGATNAPLEARLHVFGVGYDVNTHLLDRLAADNGGSVTYVQPGEDVELALTAFYDNIAHPLLTDVEIEFEGLEPSDLYPAQPPDLFQGSSLLLAGRYRPTAEDGQITVTVRAAAGEEQREFVYRFDLAEAGDRDFVPRLWATRRAGALLDQIRVKGESQELADQVRLLGLRYGIVTPYTTFVIESQADGAASAANMDLYGAAGLNEAVGRVTIQARVQNQQYQQAAQAGLAVGANVANFGQRSLAQVGSQQVDLALLQDQQLDGPITGAWLDRHLEPDRTVQFGSDEYFALAADPEIRPFLQSGPNVVFSYGGETIAVQDPDFQPPDASTKAVPVYMQNAAPDAGRPDTRLPGLNRVPVLELLRLLVRLAPLGLGAMLLALATVLLVVRYVALPRHR